MKFVLGLDPGATGGICAISSDRSVAELISSSDLEHETCEAIRRLVAKYDIQTAIVERVASFPGQGATSTFTFGRRYGLIRGVLLALSVPLRDVAPQTWQKVLGLSIDKSSNAGLTEDEKKKKRTGRRKEQKSKNYAYACSMFPTLDITKETADGVLLAEYGLRII